MLLIRIFWSSPNRGSCRQVATGRSALLAPAVIQSGACEQRCTGALSLHLKI